MTTDSNIRIGIVGCGAVTQKNYANTFPVISGISVKYLYDLNEQNARKAADIFNAEILPLDSMKARVDAIIIATPPQTHVRLVTESLVKGNIVICEKPFVGRRADADMLVEMAKKTGSQLYVAHFRRMFTQVQLVRSVIASGIFGSVIGLRIIEGGRFSWDAQSGYVMTDPMGGVLFDTGSHTIDAALFAANLDQDPISFTLTSMHKDKTEPSHEIRAAFSFDGKNGKGDGMVHFSRYRVLANKISIICERGTVEFSVGLSNRVRLVGASGVSIVFAEKEFSNFMEPFALQYQTIFFGSDRDIFNADRFLNLTSLLELLSHG